MTTKASWCTLGPGQSRACRWPLRISRACSCQQALSMFSTQTLHPRHCVLCAYPTAKPTVRLAETLTYSRTGRVCVSNRHNS